MTEPTLPPARAYLAIEKTMPDTWMLREIPERGERMIVIGGDGIPTTWQVASGEADALAALVSHAGCRVASRTPYDDSPPSRIRPT